MGYNPASPGLGHIQLCEQAIQYALFFGEITPFPSPFLGLRLSGPFRFSIINRAPHVSRNFLCIPITLNVLKWVFTASASIAIWNKNTIVILLATGVWGIHLGFLIQGKFPLFLPSCRRT